MFTRRTLLPVLVCLLAALTATTATPSAAADGAAWLDDLDGYVEKTMQQWGVPGLAIAVVKDGEVVLARGYGVRELGVRKGSAAVDEKTLFAIGSASKAFTAAAVAMLAADGTLDLDDPVIDHLPDFRLFDPYATREMTVRDLLCHRSGLSRGDLLWYGTSFSREEVLARVRHLEPSWSFRAQFGYQNIMFLAAGLVVEARTGTSWDAFVDERIFTPLGMAASNTSADALDGRKNVATPHARFDGAVQPVPWRNIDNIAPAGSINSNVTEMAHWLRLQLSGGTFDGDELIPQTLVDEMHTQQMALRNEGRWKLFFPASEFTGYGLGWFVNDYRGKKIVEHGGAIDGMRALVSMLPAEDLGLVVLSNLGGSNAPEAVRYRIYDLYLGGEARNWSDEIHEGVAAGRRQATEAREQREASRATDTKPSHAMRAYVGDYTHVMYTDVAVTLDAGRLQIAFGDTFRGPMEHWQHDTFRVAWDHRMLGEAFVTFSSDVDGQVTAVEVEGIAEWDAKTAAGN